MITPFTIKNDQWYPITTAGMYGKCFLDIDGDEAKGKVDIRIFHTEGTPQDSDLTLSPRLYKPNDNVQFMLLEPDSPLDIFYARAFNEDDEAQIIVDEIGGTAIIPGVNESSLQDNTSPWNDFYFVQANGAPTTLTAAVATAGDTRLLTVASITNISIGDWLGVFSGAVEGEERYYWAEVVDINGLVLTMQTLIDYTFPIGSTVLSTTKNMAVDGSVTPQVFSIQAGGGSGDLAIDISRVMMGSLTDTSVSLAEFADIPALTNGIFLRVKENGVYRNKMIARTNYDLAKFAYDWAPYAATNPNQGQDGFNWRFSLNGQDKHGAVSRVFGGNIGTLEWVIQDDLTDILLLESVGANHEVTI